MFSRIKKLEQDKKLTVQSVTEESQRIINLRHDTDKTEGKICSQIHACRPEMDEKKNQKKTT